LYFKNVIDTEGNNLK